MERYTLEQQLMLIHRIACPEIGYPPSEALFTSIEDWEDVCDLHWSEVLKRYKETRSNTNSI